MNRRSIINIAAVVVAIHVVAVAFYLVRTGQLDAVLTALTPVYIDDRLAENTYTPPTPIKIKKFTPSIVAPRTPTGDKVEIFS